MGVWTHTAHRYSEKPKSHRFSQNRSVSWCETFLGVASIIAVPMGLGPPKDDQPFIRDGNICKGIEISCCSVLQYLMYAGSRSVGKFLYCVGENWVKHLEATFALNTIAAQALRQVDAHTRRKNWCWPSSASRPKHPSMAQLLARYLKPQQENSRKVHVFVFFNCFQFVFLEVLRQVSSLTRHRKVRGGKMERGNFWKRKGKEDNIDNSRLRQLKTQDLLLFQGNRII